MEEGFRLWANPSSPHAEGRKARALLEDARERIKAALGWDGELIFTSGASEAAEIAILENRAALHFVSAVEHDAIFGMRSYFEDVVRVFPDGKFDVRDLDYMSVPPGDYGVQHFVALQHVNSETGNRQEIGMAAEIVHDRGGVMLVDCAQSAGKIPVPRVADMAVASAHKFGGPVGVGALLLKDFELLNPTGGQERGYRRGTENLPAALGMAAALDACGSPYLDPSVLEPMNALAAECRSIGGTWLSDELSDPTPFILAIAMPGLSGSSQVMRFDMAGISVSQGSACSSGTMKPSRVLEAMGVERDVAERTIRVSLGWTTTRAEVERFCEVWVDMARATL